MHAGRLRKRGKLTWTGSSVHGLLSGHRGGVRRGHHDICGLIGGLHSPILGKIRCC